MIYRQDHWRDDPGYKGNQQQGMMDFLRAREFRGPVHPTPESFLAKAASYFTVLPREVAKTG